MDKIALVLGGSGFVGTPIVEGLLAAGWRVRVGVRNVAKARARFGDRSAVEVVSAPIRDAAALEMAAAGCALVVNCVGILAEYGAQSFDAVQRDGAIALAQTARSAGAQNFVQISSLASDVASDSLYARTKGEAEAGVVAIYPDAIILRPSLVFGPGDGFFHRFAAMSRLSPFLPVIGDGRAQFQPVYVNDVADALLAALDMDAARGQIYELGGPETYSFRELMDYIVKIIPRRRFVASLPLPMAQAIAATTAWLPGAPITADQLRLLKFDTVVSTGALGLADLGVEATALEAIVPTYIS